MSMSMISKSIFPPVLILRPASLMAGIGCNRNTAAQKYLLLKDVLAKNNLASASLKCMASIDVKADETGLITFGPKSRLGCYLFYAQELNRVKASKIHRPLWKNM